LVLIACSIGSTSCKDEAAEARIKVLEESVNNLEAANHELRLEAVEKSVGTGFMAKVDDKIYFLPPRVFYQETAN
jgi:hypothetical protein